MTPSPPARRRRGRHRLLRNGSLVVFVVTVTVVSGCTFDNSRGVEIGHLRDLARRVIGGGVECPLAILPGELRPATADEDAPILPLRTDGPGSNATIGEEPPVEGNVRIMCRYDIDGLAVTLVVAGVPDGHALGTFGDLLADHGDPRFVLTFIDENTDLPVERVRSLPGPPPASFTRIQASHGDVALVLTVEKLRDDATLPTAASVDASAAAIARSIAS